MAVFHPHTVTCACGAKLIVLLADTINAKRSPEAREKILRGELHKVACATCGREMIVEKPFYYSDFARNVLFRVAPRGERHTWKQASKSVEAASALIPQHVAKMEERQLRVVFGMDELREKLVAQDAGYDDRTVELFKVLVIYEHPFLLRQRRLRLTLAGVSDTELAFLGAYEHDRRRFNVAMPRTLADDFAGNPEKLQDWVKKAHNTNLFDLPDHWVNIWRWSPQPSALDQLRAYAEAITAGQTIDTSSRTFVAMMSGLPRGTQLPSWAKQDLRVLFEYAKKHSFESLEDDLFEIRFGIELEDDWSTNEDRDDIDTLWMLLKDLPDTNVEGNTKIRELLLDEGVGGGVYDPRSHDIAIGSRELATRERFEDVVRHEIGHAVHEMNDTRVNQWLTQQFGWRVFGRGDAEIDAWIALMGGWGGLSATQQRDVRNALRTALGRGSSWNPGPDPSMPPGHPWYRADFGPRLAYEKTGADWYRNFRTWHRANGKAFYLNYWYATFISVDESALQLVAQMPDDYAAMSHYEFFAELYALYYDLDDPQRGAIPKPVSDWLNQNIGAPEPGAPRPSRPSPKSEWETIKRP